MENNTPLTDAALAELDRLHAAATPGEWKFSFYCKPDGAEIKTVEDVAETLAYSGRISPRAELFGVSVDDGKDICMTGNGPTSHVNAEYIPALHNAYPALRQRLAEAERDRDELRQQLHAAVYIIELEGHGTEEAKALLAARDAQQRREGAAEWLESFAQKDAFEKLAYLQDETLLQAAKRLREEK